MDCIKETKNKGRKKINSQIQCDSATNATTPLETAGLLPFRCRIDVATRMRHFDAVLIFEAL